MKEKIRVLHVDTGKGWRGGQQQAVYLYEGMLNRNYKTNFVCRPKSKLSSYFSKKGLPHIEVNVKNELDLISAYKISQICKKEEFNILHLHSAHALSIGIFAKLFNSSLITIGVRRVSFHVNKNLISRLKYNNSLVNKIVCISDAVKNVLISDGIHKDKLITIHSGINTDRFRPPSVPPTRGEVKIDEKFKEELGFRKDHIIIGTVAALVGHKDYPTLLKAAEIVINKTDNVSFCAVGSGEDEKKILDLANNLELKNRFKFTGYREDVGKLLKMFDIFVMASKEEGLGTSILDAQSVGLPVVGTKAGGIPEAVKDNVNGLLVPIQNPEKLAYALIELVNNKEKRVNLGRKGKKTVKQFDIKNTVEKNIQLYRLMIDD